MPKCLENYNETYFSARITFIVHLATEIAQIARLSQMHVQRKKIVFNSRRGADNVHIMI